ncbi:hypothetical protein PSACC_00882 [Paramicrosporidium saccamoebae]|uniref:Uncharacterized protein n=1 Tax=Paramicrosporidium saccamoebae TaxID=1246581 RepID=A0A2H9TNR2_9FUNG|nr:hypothetical protein PSACC_00882 [Paramicrosporidium saccamoebae]
MGRKRGARELAAALESEQASTPAPVKATLNLLNTPGGDIVDDGPITYDGSSEVCLARRLGRSGDDLKNEISGCFAFESEFLKGLSLGDQADALELFEKKTSSALIRQQQVEAQMATASEDLCSLVSECLDLKMLSPRMVSIFLSRIESGKNFFPVPILNRLFIEGYISDVAHPIVLEKILAHQNIYLMFNYMNYVADVREETVARLISYFLEQKTVQAPAFPAFTACESVILSLMAWNFNATVIKFAVKNLDLDSCEIILQTLERALRVYSQVHAEAIAACPGTANPCQFPSRANVVKWIEAIIDSQYPHLMSRSPTIELVNSLGKLVSEECDLTEHLVNIRAALSTVSHVAKRYGKDGNNRVPEPYVYTNYTVEMSNFL